MKKGIIFVLSTLAGAAAGAGAVKRKEGKNLSKVQEKADRYSMLFRMMVQWTQVKQEGKNLAAYFEKEGYKKIAIYGMGDAGKTLISELRDTGVEIAYGIDRRADSLYADIDIFTLEDSLEEVDAIVVTAVTFFDEIEEQLSERVNCPIISLEDILYEI